MFWAISLSNLIMVNKGLNAIRNLMSSGTASADTAPTIGVVGSHSFTPAASDTSLTGSYFGDDFDVNTVSDKANEYELLLAANEGNATIHSIGIFNDGGDLFAEDTFTSITKTGSMEVQFDIKVTYADL
jgi:hypothetical protein